MTRCHRTSQPARGLICHALKVPPRPACYTSPSPPPPLFQSSSAFAAAAAVSEGLVARTAARRSMFFPGSGLTCVCLFFGFPRTFLRSRSETRVLFSGPEPRRTAPQIVKQKPLRIRLRKHQLFC